MKKIELNKFSKKKKGFEYALVDDEDYNWLAKRNWYAHKEKNTCYAYTNSKKTCIKMHRLILENPSSYIDHINHNGLDNRKSNLRLCTNTENNRNKKLTISNKSGYKGVSWDKASKKWVVRIKNNGKYVNLGRFLNKKDGAKIYNEYAIKHFGKFAYLNKI